jgi:hypothetical protein
MSIAAMNLFLDTTGLSIINQGNHYLVTSEVPAYYVYVEDRGFCYIGSNTLNE